MLAYHLCETLLVERTADAFEAHSVSVGGSPYGDHICPLEDLGLLERGRLFCPGTGWCGRMGGGGGYRCPAGRTVRMTAGHTAAAGSGDDISKLVAGP